MTRILITGKNCDLSREAFSRAARHIHATSQPTRRAVLYSGMMPDSEAGGTRAPTTKDNRNPESQSLCTGPESPQTFRLGAATRLAVDFAVLAGIAVACVTLMVLASL